MADKGSITVVRKKTTYMEKLQKHLNDGVTIGTYLEVHNTAWVERFLRLKYGKAAAVYNAWSRNAKAINVWLNPIDEPDGQYVAPIYGTVKVHKEGSPIRPIISDPNNVLNQVQQALVTVLKVHIEETAYQFMVKNTSVIGLTDINCSKFAMLENICKDWSHIES